MEFIKPTFLLHISSVTNFVLLMFYSRNVNLSAKSKITGNLAHGLVRQVKMIYCLKL